MRWVEEHHARATTEFLQEWVIIATERAPTAGGAGQAARSAECGVVSRHLSIVPGEREQNSARGGAVSDRCGPAWAVRVIPNKFAALSADVPPTRNLQPLRRRMEGFGFHEVVIDSPDHCCRALLPDAKVAKILGIFKERYNSLSADQRINHVTSFKNHGTDAGASLQHPHSQIIATPVIPGQVRHRRHETLRHFDDARECMFCHRVEREVADQTRSVPKSELFVAMEVFASPTPFATHRFPLRSAAPWPASAKSLLRKLSTWHESCGPVLAKICLVPENPDFNFTLRRAPSDYVGARHFHW
jgi:UDPglucose--hexose-1-phosphate uridylyltransferase